MTQNNLQAKIAIIGAGAVGSTLAYTLMLKNLGSEVILIDLNKEKVEGEILDINDTISLLESENIRQGEYLDAREADIIVLTAGAAQKPGENRLDLVKKNKNIAETIFKEIGPLKDSAIVLVVSNPVDIITALVQKISGLPVSQVFGTGTSLDSARLRTHLAKRLAVDSNQIDGFVLGEHGDSEFVAWSTVSLAGQEIVSKLTEAEKESLEESIKKEAYEIINRKGATYYGIATVTADIIESILFNQNKVLPVTHFLEDWNGVSGLCLGAPAVVGRNGIIKNWPLVLPTEEKEKFKKSAELIKQYL